MSFKTHFVGARRVAVIIFLFVNCLLAAIPFNYASSTDNGQEAPTGYLSQTHSQPDNEENNHLKHSDDRYEYQYSVRKKKTSRFLNTATTDNVSPKPFVDDSPAHYFISSSYPARPEYYNSLHLYQLF